MSVMAKLVGAKRYLLYFSVICIGLVLFSFSSFKSKPITSNKSKPITSNYIETRKKITRNAAIDVALILADVKANPKFRKSFKITMSSLLNKSSQNMNLHVIGDDDGRSYVDSVLRNIKKNITVKVIGYDIESIVSRHQDELSVFRPHFTIFSNLSYYAKDLFLITPLMHRVFNSSVSRIIVIDTDLYFKEDIAVLYKEFDSFNETHVAGSAPELSPVYFHILYKYRQSHPQTTKGSPGHQGFNIGVLMLHLDHMRSNSVYQELLKKETLIKVADEFSFKGHLGGQDFFTLLGYAHPELLYTLSCGWNKQLCTWWRDHGYANVFEKYAACNDSVKLTDSEMPR